MRTQSRARTVFNAIGRTIRSLFFLAIIGSALYWLGNEGWLYWQTRALFPAETTVAGLDVGGMSRSEAIGSIYTAYGQPIMVMVDQSGIEIQPEDAGFEIVPDPMVDDALDELYSRSHWQRYANHVLNESLDIDAIEFPPIHVPISATHSITDVVFLADTIGTMLDSPAEAPQLLTTGDEIDPGRDGRVLDREQAQQEIISALYRPTDRIAMLELEIVEAPEMTLEYLELYIEQQLQTFDGTGVVYVLDLETGEEIAINADAAVSGLSIVKIAIMLEALRAIDGQLTFDEAKLFEETAIFSGNFSANLLLDIVAGQDNAYLGSDVLTQSMQRLGLVNTFIVTPYEEPDRAGKVTLQTPANSRLDINLTPDTAMQTTAEEMGRLLGMIYSCAQGGGTLIAIYPDEITPAECQYLISLLAQNDEGNLIRFGVPEEVTVAHKHGWAFNTHGDAGIVLSEGGDYVIVEYLYADTDWLPVNFTFPLLREISRSVYNFYNADRPYVDHKRAQRVAGQFAAEQAAVAANEQAPFTPPAEPESDN